MEFLPQIPGITDLRVEGKSAVHYPSCECILALMDYLPRIQIKKLKLRLVKCRFLLEVFNRIETENSLRSLETFTLALPFQNNEPKHEIISLLFSSLSKTKISKLYIENFGDFYLSPNILTGTQNTSDQVLNILNIYPSKISTVILLIKIHLIKVTPSLY